MLKVKGDNNSGLGRAGDFDGGVGAWKVGKMESNLQHYDTKRTCYQWKSVTTN